ncbi:hypothetical protein JW992_02410 [candidate division KSB1 bacterium]|nr:hypothetical protein [candidate division KSB1 bacterium]
MQRFWVVLGVLCLSCYAVQAQIARSDVDDAFRELDEQLTLRFYHALTGQPIPNARVEIDSIGVFQTDQEGAAILPIPESDGVYRVVFSHADFIRSAFSIEIMAGTLFFNRFSVSPVLPVGTLRAVLDWGENPRDLDAHLVKAGHYHIAYHHKRVSDDGLARLDRDDRDGFGPETITINQVDGSADYTYYIHDYSHRDRPDSRHLSDSRATVKVFGNSDQLLYVLQVPVGQSGIYWPVFRIRDGRIVPSNAYLTGRIE